MVCVASFRAAYTILSSTFFKMVDANRVAPRDTYTMHEHTIFIFIFAFFGNRIDKQNLTHFNRKGKNVVRINWEYNWIWLTWMSRTEFAKQNIPLHGVCVCAMHVLFTMHSYNVFLFREAGHSDVYIWSSPINGLCGPLDRIFNESHQ